ncbi:hypothetical protein HDU77_008779 [Chytriomyces hyalinus]|nr:hypothetical protein HDU77_008779 [Chytriomyces hyalinus]
MAAAVPCTTLITQTYFTGTTNAGACNTLGLYTGNAVPAGCGPSTSYNPTAVTQQLDNINPKPTSSFVGSAGSQIVVYAVPTNLGQSFNVGNAKLSFKAGSQTRTVSWTKAYSTANTVGAPTSQTTVSLTYSTQMNAVQQSIIGWGYDNAVCKFTAAATGTSIYPLTNTAAFTSTVYNLAVAVPTPTATVTYGFYAGVAQIDATLQGGDYISSMYIPVDLTVPTSTTMTTTSNLVDTSISCSVVEEDFTVAETPGATNTNGALRWVLKCTPGAPTQYGIADIYVAENGCSANSPTVTIIHGPFSLQFAGHTTPASTSPFVGIVSPSTTSPFSLAGNLANGMAYGLFETNNAKNGNIPNLPCGQTYNFPVTISMCHVTAGVCDDGSFIDYRMMVSATATTACKISFQVAPDTLSLTLTDSTEGNNVFAGDQWIASLRATSGSSFFTGYGITDAVGLDVFNGVVATTESITAIPLTCFKNAAVAGVSLTPTTQLSIVTGSAYILGAVMDPSTLGPTNAAANAAACKFVVPNAARTYRLSFKFKLYTNTIVRRDGALARRADDGPEDRSMAATFRIDNAAPAAASVGASVGVIAGAASAAVVACAVVIGALVVVRKRNLSQKKHEALPSSEMFVTA